LLITEMYSDVGDFDFVNYIYVYKMKFALCQGAKSNWKVMEEKLKIFSPFG